MDDQDLAGLVMEAELRLQEFEQAQAAYIAAARLRYLTSEALASALGLPPEGASWSGERLVVSSWEAVAALPGTVVRDWYPTGGGQEQRDARVTCRVVPVVVYQHRVRP